MIEENKDLKHDLQSVWPAVKVLLKNSSFICVSVAIAADGLATSGFATFLPKFVETQFYFTASNSALYTGIIVIPGRHIVFNHVVLLPAPKVHRKLS